MAEQIENQAQEEREKAATALRYIIPILEKHHLRWCISGGFACHLYGVDRPIGQQIDIDVEIDKDDPKFQGLIEETKSHTQDFPFQLWIDENYDNWVMNVDVGGQILSVCDSAHLKLFNKESGDYELFYPNGIPNPTLVEFEGLQIPLAPKESVLKMKEALAHKKEIDNIDTEGMRRILASA